MSLKANLPGMISAAPVNRGRRQFLKTAAMATAGATLGYGRIGC